MYKPRIKFKSAYRILGVMRGVLDGVGFFSVGILEC